MATTKDRALLRQLGTLFHLGTVGELTDGQLLERFARGDGEDAEPAFAELVERHGAMVLRVCRAQLRDPHDTQDAFQATFLVLVEKARGLWVRDSLGPWLHQVALRTASCARSAALRRRRFEHRSAEMASDEAREEDPGRSELARVLHEEIDRLPERYRVPIVLCDLEGRTCEEAARVMGRPVGTIKSWRARGRERLRTRLIRSGLAPSAAIGAALFPDAARAAVPRMTADLAVRAAARLLSDPTTAGVVPASVSLLVKGVINSMILRKLRTAIAAVGTLGFLATGLVAVSGLAADDPKRAAEVSPAAGSPRASVMQSPGIVTKPATLGGEAWPLSLRDAIRIALDNSEIIRVISLGTEGRPVGGFETTESDKAPDPARADAGVAPIVIARRNTDVAPSRFKAELMAVVRSVEQQYWNLSVAYIDLQAAERALALARELHDRERAGLKTGHGDLADVAEAAQRLDQLNLDLVTRTSDAITCERQLRNLLGLPPADNRRIVPITLPTEARLEPDWDKCLAAMLENQPDILEARAMVKRAEGLAASDELNRAADAFQPAPAGDAGRSPSAASAPDRPSPLVARQTAYLQQVVHQTTHSLARFILEIETGYKQFRAASRIRADAERRLQALRAEYEAGRAPLDRLLHAASQYAAAVATESQHKATYNISQVALEEAKGTLLEFDKIVVVDAPKDSDAAKAARPDAGVKPASHEPASRVATPAAGAKAGAAKAEADGKTYSFQLSIGIGSSPIEIRGSFTVRPAQEGR